MLREIPSARQTAGEPRRRWFHCEEQDLYVWEDEDGGILEFQLYYGKLDAEHALVWKPGKGLAHLGVDHGVDPVGNMTPLLVANGSLDAASVRIRFRQLAIRLPSSMVEFVCQHILPHGGSI